MTNLRPQMNHHDTFTSCQDRRDGSRLARFLSALPSRVLPLIVALLVVPLLTGCGEETPKLENGQAAPAFALPDLAGKTWQLPTDFQGQVVALRFWLSLIHI